MNDVKLFRLRHFSHGGWAVYFIDPATGKEYLTCVESSEEKAKDFIRRKYGKRVKFL